jgi:pyruvate dehydrogenase E2 component (dihydrolipoamide acetyltransferase)
MPTLGMAMADGEIVRWLVKEGDQVAADQQIVEIETSKVNVIIPAPVGGTLRKIVAPEGSSVKVGEVMAMIGEQEEPIPEGTS